MTAEILHLPRRPLREEMFEALNSALDATDEFRRAYWKGCATGYAIAFGIETPDLLTDARLQNGARGLHISELHAHLPWHSKDEPQSWWACGVLWGYKQGTSERDDAHDCETCGDRLTDDDDYDRCEVGRFCPGSDCHAIAHDGRGCPDAYWPSDL